MIVCPQSPGCPQDGARQQAEVTERDCVAVQVIECDLSPIIGRALGARNTRRGKFETLLGSGNLTQMGRWHARYFMHNCKAVSVWRIYFV